MNSLIFENTAKGESSKVLQNQVISPLMTVYDYYADGRKKARKTEYVTEFEVISIFNKDASGLG
jgi:hypothetical protein